MQSPTPNSKKTKKDSPFIKWLPAILLALVIHGALLAFFLNSQKNTPVETTATPEKVETFKVPIDLENEKEVLLTLIEERTTAEKQKLAQQNKEGEEDNKSTDQNTEDQQNEKDATKAQANKQNNSENESSDNKQAASKPEPEKAPNKAPTQQQNSGLDNTGYMPPAQVNPNDQVLLPRDIPQAEQNIIAQNNRYTDTAEQSEDINDKLSSMVNEIKEQKLRKIEAQRQASKEAYLKNHPAASEVSLADKARDVELKVDEVDQKPDAEIETDK